MSNSKSIEYLFAYDISDNKERRKTEKLLKGYGFRRQLSVFICRLTRGDKVRLLSQLKKLSLKTGFVLVVRVAQHTHPDIIGMCTVPDIDTDCAFIV